MLPLALVSLPFRLLLIAPSINPSRPILLNRPGRQHPEPHTVDKKSFELNELANEVVVVKVLDRIRIPKLDSLVTTGGRHLVGVEYAGVKLSRYSVTATAILAALDADRAMPLVLRQNGPEFFVRARTAGLSLNASCHLFFHLV
jgi:hypothetical protein